MMSLRLVVGLCAVAVAWAQVDEYVLFVKWRVGSQAIVESELEAVSTPSSPRYRAFLPHEDVLQLQRPSAEHQTLVWKHIETLIQKYPGVEAELLSPAGDKISIRVPSSLRATVKYGHVVPQAILDVCDYVGGNAAGLAEVDAPAENVELVRRNKARAAARRSTRSFGRKFNLGSKDSTPAMQQTLGLSSVNPQACMANQVDPPCLRKSYGLNNTIASATTKNLQCVAVNEYYSPDDLKSFRSQYKLPEGTVTVAKDFAGKNIPGEAGTECSLDLEYIMTTGLRVPTYWVYLDQSDPNPFTSWLTWAASVADLPYVHSLSVGVPESEFETLGINAIVRMNYELASMGLRGASIMFASGDSGQQGNFVNYPASSPYVTACGGVWNGDLGLTALSVDPLTTGGFSQLDANPIPFWQKAAVEHWATDTKGTRPRSFNTSQRAVPDVAIFDTSYQVVVGGGPTPVGGTSCAAPTFSGIISMINEELLANGKPAMGFLNPFLYSNADLFLDITRGGNVHYAATPGYDPVSGIGSLYVDTFGTLRAAALAA